MKWQQRVKERGIEREREKGRERERGTASGVDREAA